VTKPSGDSADDAFWRRPAGPPADPPPPPDRPAEVTPPYTGPPPNTMPPPGWQPTLHVQPPPPRTLPPQDLPALDAAENSARTLTYGIGMVAGAVVLVLMCLLCARVLF